MNAAYRILRASKDSSASPSRSGGMYSHRQARVHAGKRAQRSSCNSGDTATAY